MNNTRAVTSPTSPFKNGGRQQYSFPALLKQLEIGTISSPIISPKAKENESESKIVCLIASKLKE